MNAVDRINEAIDIALGAARGEIKALSCTPEVQYGAFRYATAKEKKLRRLCESLVEENERLQADRLTEEEARDLSLYAPEISAKLLRLRSRSEEGK